MKSWMLERDRLIEQTMAFVEGVAAANPARTAEAAAPPPEPDKMAEPPAPAQRIPIAAVVPAISERAEIERRVAKFKAQQRKFQQAREQDYHEIFSKSCVGNGNAVRA